MVDITPPEFGARLYLDSDEDGVAVAKLMFVAYKQGKEFHKLKDGSFSALWSTFDFIMPDYLFSYRYFREHFEAPIVKDGNEQSKQSLQRIVSPFILRRMKSEVLTELPDKTETVLLSDMEGDQCRLYSANVSAVKEAVSGSDGGNTEKIKILAMLTRLRQICCDPALVY